MGTKLEFVVCYQTRTTRRVGETRVAVNVCAGAFYEAPEKTVARAERTAAEKVARRYPWRIPTVVICTTVAY